MNKELYKDLPPAVAACIAADEAVYSHKISQDLEDALDALRIVAEHEGGPHPFEVTDLNSGHALELVADSFEAAIEAFQQGKEWTARVADQLDWFKDDPIELEYQMQIEDLFSGYKRVFTILIDPAKGA